MGEMTRSLDEILARGVAGGDPPGVIAAAATGEAVLYRGAFGIRNADGAAMDADSVVWIASMTKPVTAAAAMQLVEEGRLELDRPLGAILPELAHPRVLEGFDADGKPLTRPARAPITLRRLLTHTAGFGYAMWNADLGRYQAAATAAGPRTGRAGLDQPLLFDPGASWEYGIGIDWAGLAIEAVTGERLGERLRARIFDPLGMIDTGFMITPAMRPRLAKVWQRGEDGAFTATDFELPQAPEIEGGGGGLYSTAADYLRFIRMILNGGELDGARVLAPATIEAMAANAIGDLSMRALKTTAPTVTGDLEFYPQMRKTWGLSFMINTEATAAGRNPHSLAWAGLANTYFWIDRAAGVGGLCLAQMFPFADAKALDLFHSFERGVYDRVGG